MSQLPNTHRFKIALEVLSPVFIGAGKQTTLSPYSDFVQRDNKIYYINHSAVEAALAKHSNSKSLINRYVDGISRGMDNNRSDFNLGKLLEKDLGLSLEKISYAHIPIRGEIKQSAIYRHIASVERPFVPGSSLKGAIRTALLYKHLTTKAGQNVATGILTKPKQEYPIEHPFTCVFNPSGNIRVPKPNNEDITATEIKVDEMRRLRVSDSSLGTLQDLEVSEIRSAIQIFENIGVNNRRKSANTIPVWCETLRPGTSFQFEISFLSGSQLPILSPLNGETPEQLFAAINDFSFASVDRELYCLDRGRTYAESNITVFYEQLLRAINSAGKHEAIVRIGGKKTYFDNSIALALEQYGLDDNYNDKEGKLKNYLSKMVEKNITDYHLFPRTRSFVFRDRQPFSPAGWMRLTWNSFQTQ